MGDAPHAFPQVDPDARATSMQVKILFRFFFAPARETAPHPRGEWGHRAARRPRL